MVITCCPDCHARFRVTDGQLKLARGQVRCGACLCVFDARVHALPDSSTGTPQTTAPKPAKSDTRAQQPAAGEPRTEAEVTTEASRPAWTKPEPVSETNAETKTEAPAGAKPASQAPSPSRTAGLANIKLPFNAEPIAFSSRDNDDNPVATAGWLLLSLVAALALAAQLLWFERARLALYPELGSVYTLLCEQVDCSLTQNVLTLIDNQGLHLQPHPKFSDALRATVLLENKASFSQPWPGLLLRFTDLKGRLVAQRTFQPEEYLDTGNIDPMHMPTGQPVQIELELAAPGRRGVSYELRLAPATAAKAK